MKLKDYTVLFLVILFAQTAQIGKAAGPGNMVWIPAGEFVMGGDYREAYADGLPFHPVFVSSMYMDKFEVTKALWDEVRTWAITHGYEFENLGKTEGEKHPVHWLSWYDVVKWCNARSEKENRIPAYYIGKEKIIVYRKGQVDIENNWVEWNAGYRLPTEAEWEKAARGGLIGKKYPWGDTINRTQANYLQSGIYSTTPVGSYPPNGYGLHDMAGNVWEWCWDWHTSYTADTATDPQGPIFASARITRGGSSLNDPYSCAVAYRFHDTPNPYYRGSGFRTVLPSFIPHYIGEFLDVQVRKQPTYSCLIDKEPGKKKLVIATHGWNPDLTWLEKMTDEISKNLIRRRLTDWQVAAYKWVEKAKTISPKTALENAKKEGANLGLCLSSQQWNEIHFIAHSAGAGLVQVALETLKNYFSTTIIHVTFLDPFVGFDYEGLLTYGKGADWADCYFSRDRQTGGESFPLTQGALSHAFTVDVTLLDEHKFNVNAYYSTMPEPCYHTVSSHRWPIEFYLKTIVTDTWAESEGFGFPLSQEGGNWEYAKNNYKPNNAKPKSLGQPDVVCPPFFLPAKPVISAPVTDFRNVESVKSLTEKVDNNGKSLIFSIDSSSLLLHSLRASALEGSSSAWLTSALIITNSVNFVSFDARFLSSNGEGILSLYSETNLIGSIDERLVLPGLRRYAYPLPQTITNGDLLLSFCLDSYSGKSSSVMVTNVALGFAGLDENFNLTFVGTNTHGVREFKLTGPIGYNYMLETTSNLIDWMPIAILVNTNGTVNFVDSNQDNFQRFYRVSGD